MDHIPTRDGRPCVFRVARVSGTIRKAEEEAVRRARQMMLAVRDQVPAKDAGAALDSFFADSRRRSLREAATSSISQDGFDIGDDFSEDEAMEDHVDD
jgi:ribonuclease P/MRP protein subunit POP5